MDKYSILIFACLKTPYNKPFNWEFVTLNLTAFSIDCFNTVNNDVFPSILFF